MFGFLLPHLLLLPRLSEHLRVQRHELINGFGGHDGTRHRLCHVCHVREPRRNHQRADDFGDACVGARLRLLANKGLDDGTEAVGGEDCERRHVDTLGVFQPCKKGEDRSTVLLGSDSNDGFTLALPVDGGDAPPRKGVELRLERRRHLQRLDAWTLCGGAVDIGRFGLILGACP